MIFIAEPYRQIFGQIGFSPEMIFTSPAVKPWRQLKDRENCIWDIPAPTGAIRLHVKRFPAVRAATPAQLEADGYRALHDRGIPAATVAAWGELNDGRSFIATEDLSGFAPADKLIESGLPFDRLLAPTADLAAQLHNGGLHHRDLYLCHFLARSEAHQPADLHLIDAARVGPLPGPLTRRRWIVKDLAQFWYSMLVPAISESQRAEWLARYCLKTKISQPDPLRKSILRKSNAIAVHDQKLRRTQPHRNISIPNI